MRIHFGYVAVVLSLPEVTSSSTLTFSRYKKMISEEEKINHLKKVTLSNLDDLYKILEYNVEHNIHFYRITSRLIPLATHPEVNWDYQKYFHKDFQRIGKLLKKTSMRVDTHPDQFNVINSIKPEVVEKTETDLLYHISLFQAMDYKVGKMVIHIGSGQKGKEAALRRFVDHYHTFDPRIQKSLIIENDDKTFNVEETLRLCQEINCPMVLDIHHHICNPTKSPLEKYMEQIVRTWDQEELPPKVHLSSPRDGGKDRKHADYINVEDCLFLIEKLQSIGANVDIMLECKKKEQALFQLVEDLKRQRPQWKWVDNTTLEI